MSPRYKKTKEDLAFEQNQRAILTAPLFGIGAAAPFVLTGKDEANSIGGTFSSDKTERALALKDVGATDLDPTLRNRYLNQGPYGLITDNSTQIVKGYVPEGYHGFKPSDLSNAGTKPPVGPNTKRQITVSPGPQPRRLSYEGLNELDLGADGQKGYIWGNNKTPQYGYAVGNFNRGRVKSSNPAVNFLDVDMSDDRRTQFATTGDVVSDKRFATDRLWGKRGNDYGGDAMFPKETISKRYEVTAADVYTYAKNNNIQVEPGDFSRNPGKAFKELVEGVAEKSGRPSVQLLEDLATEVPALGQSNRNAGEMPSYTEFDVGNTSPANLKRAGIGTVYVGTDHQSTRSVPRGKELKLETTGGDINTNYRRAHFDINPDLINTNLGRVSNFIRRQSGVGALTGIGFAMDPSINQALRENRYGDATMVATGSLFAGLAGEAIVKNGLNAMAQRGVTVPLRFASVAAPPVAAIQTLSLAERSTPTGWKQLGYKSKADYEAAKAKGYNDALNEQPTFYGKLGPDAPRFNPTELKRRRALPYKTQQVMAAPLHQQLQYNINNEMKYRTNQAKKKLNQAGSNLKNESDYILNQIRQGKVPYWPF